ncbi:hypothetical protein [Herbaspirillum sp. ST 5-3]|uniref:hypothetical protein n=1 Tax=Oxalobacteraceae TaxID=75682 RepID=UPI0010A49429|nr:hypothetical protein [Herbaspirillum sp. ST 5-3]
MLLFSDAHRRRSAATFALLGWLMALFVSIAHACVPPQQASTWTAAERMEASIASHSDCTHDDSQRDPNTCKMFCDAQTSAVVKEKSLDLTGMDLPTLTTPAYIVPLFPHSTSIASVPETCSQTCDPNFSLRFVRLTL